MRRSIWVSVVVCVGALSFSGPLGAQLIKPPLVAPPAIHPPPLVLPKNPECGIAAEVRNVTGGSVKVVHWWSNEEKPEILSIEASAKVAVTPVYCSSHLIIVTGESLTHRMKMKPKKRYEVVWSEENGKYLFQEFDHEKKNG